jgi:hypothetical protein
VQRWFANEVAEASKADQYEAVACSACGLVHLVNPTTGKVLPVMSNRSPSNSFSVLPKG